MTPFAAPPSDAATRSRPCGLWASTIDVDALGELGVGRHHLAAQLRYERLGARAKRSLTSTGSPHPRASAVAMLPAPMRPICMLKDSI